MSAPQAMINRRKSSRHERSGCLTCRYRRKKCVENTIPVCGACKRLNLECVREPVRNVVPNDWSNGQVAQPRIESQNQNVVIHAPHISPAVVLSDYTGTLQKRNAMRYYVTVLAPHLTVSEEFNSFLSAFLPMAMESEVLRDALIAFASGHLALVDRSYQGTALSANLIAIRNLATAISTTSADIGCHETNAAACLVLMTAEVGVGDCRSWYTHLKGAQGIISAAVMNSNYKTVYGPAAFKQSSEGQWILRNFAYHDIIGSVTLRQRPLLDCSYLESISDVVDSYLGVGTRILSFISEITCLDYETTPVASMNELHLQQIRARFHSTTSRLEKQLNDWTCPANTPDSLVAIAFAYRCAALIILYRLLRDRLSKTVFCSDDAANSRGRLLQIVQIKIKKQVDLTLAHVAEIPGGVGPESAVLFPLFIAGGETLEASQMEVVRQRLLTVLEKRRFKNVFRALEVLENLWALRQEKHCASADWTQVLESSERGMLLT